MFELFDVRQKENEKLRVDETTKEEYGNWRYTYPQVEAERTKESLDKLHVDQAEKIE